MKGTCSIVDGVVDREGQCLFASVSRYLSSCLAFAAGAPFGSVIQADGEHRTRCERFALGVLAALDLRASAFHLELFDTGTELVFLEIGARVPGADVPYVIHDVYGVNLYQLWVDVLMGKPVRPMPRDGAASGAWLMIPRPQPLPRRVVHATPLVGKVPFLYREVVPKAGDLLEHCEGYATLQGGRFLFKGGTPREILEAVHTAQRDYRLTTVAA